MTAFIKEEFIWDGMYLMYRGRHEGSKNMEEVHPDCHPSWIGKPQPTFIARFKYGYKPWKAWVNFLVKHATVEQYVELSTEYGFGTPKNAMVKLGYRGRV